MVTQSDVREFGKVIDGRRILIPPIQRDYAWDISGDSALQLWDDLDQFYKNGTTEHYYMEISLLGSKFRKTLMRVDDNDLSHKHHIWQLLDGQQRITSLTVLLNAILLELRYDTQIANGIYAVKLRTNFIRGRGIRKRGMACKPKTKACGFSRLFEVAY